MSQANTWEHFRQRLLFGSSAFLVTGAIVSLAYHPVFSFIFPLFALIATLLAQREYYAISKMIGLVPGVKVGMCGSACYIASLYVGVYLFPLFFLPWIALGGSFLFIFSSFLVRGADPLVNIAMTFFGIIYLAVPIGCAVLIPYVDLEGGQYWLFLLIATTYMTDTCALIVGKLVGVHKLAPYISPKKTWEGAIGGWGASLLTSACFASFFSAIPMFSALFLGAGVGILAQLGDLAESLLKRNVGVKDSAQIPGLGGMLDVIDSMLFTAPFFLLVLVYFVL